MSCFIFWLILEHIWNQLFEFWGCYFANSRVHLNSFLDYFCWEMHQFSLQDTFINFQWHLPIFWFFLLPPCVHSAPWAPSLFIWLRRPCLGPLLGPPINSVERNSGIYFPKIRLRKSLLGKTYLQKLEENHRRIRNYGKNPR